MNEREILGKTCDDLGNSKDPRAAGGIKKSVLIQTLFDGAIAGSGVLPAAAFDNNALASSVLVIASSPYCRIPLGSFLPSQFRRRLKWRKERFLEKILSDAGRSRD